MPYGDYDTTSIMQTVRQRNDAGATARHELQKTQKQLEVTKIQHQMAQSKLKRHEDVEKRRLNGLKKAQSKRKGVNNSAKTKRN